MRFRLATKFGRMLIYTLQAVHFGKYNDTLFRYTSGVVVKAIMGWLDAISRRFGIACLDVFESVARGEDRPGSDADRLTNLLRLGREFEGLSQDLANLFGRPVDLVSRNSLYPLIRDQALVDVETFYGAA